MDQNRALPYGLCHGAEMMIDDRMRMMLPADGTENKGKVEDGR